MFKMLDRYICRNIVVTNIKTLFILVSISSIIKFVEQLKKSGQGSYDAMGAGVYTFFSVPKDIQIFFPMSVLLGTLLGLGILAQHNELIVMQASGFSRIQIAISVIKTAVPLVLLTIVIGEYIAPQGEQIARNYRTQAMYNGSLLSTQKGIWAKDGSNFVYIERIAEYGELRGLSIYAFDQNRHLKSVRYAMSAQFDVNRKLWNLFRVNEVSFHDLRKINNSQTTLVHWETNLTPDRLSTASLDPDELPISDLRKYIQYLKYSGQDIRRYQLNMWNKIYKPVSVAVMLSLALSFIFGPLRDVSMGTRMVTGIGCGFIFYVFDQIFGALTLVYGIPPIIGALLPSLSFLSISLWLHLKCF